MVAQSRTTIIFGVLFALCSCASAFWWGTSQSSSSTPYPQYFYQQRVLQGPPSQLYPSAPPAPAPLPAVPLHVPLQAGLAPLPSVQRVQLVPCLCPVSPDLDHDRDPAAAATGAVPENLYLKPVSVTAVKNS